MEGRRRCPGLSIVYILMARTVLGGLEGDTHPTAPSLHNLPKNWSVERILLVHFRRKKPCQQDVFAISFI
jgi:hypothetical protein